MARYTIKNTIEAGFRATVRLNGAEVSNVLEADTLRGYVQRVQSGPDGRMTTINGTLITERLFGAVTVKLEKL